MSHAQTLPTEQEAARQAALDELGILDSPAEQAYDDLTRLAAYICGTPVALVSLVGKDRQFFKSAHNLEVSETPIDQSFCAHTLGTARTLIVEDAQEDPRFSENPLVTGEPGIRFYAGAPIFGEGGHVLGTLCVIDRQARVLSGEQISALEALARQVTELLHQRLLNKQQERAGRLLRKSSLQLRLAVEAGRLGIFSWYPATDTTVWENDRMYEIFGRDREQGSLSPAEFIYELVWEQDRQRLIDALAKVKLPGDRFEWTGRFRLGEERVCWIEVLGLAELDAHAEFFLVGTVSDVTQSRRDQIEAEAARERLEVALAGSGAFTFDWDPDRDEVVWGGVPPFGRAPAEVRSAAAAFEFIHPDDRGELGRTIESARAHGDGYAFTFRAFWPDGSMHWVRTSGKLFHADPEAPRRIVGTNQDISYLKLAEVELQLEQERLQLALNTSRATIFDWLPETDVVTWSGQPPFGVDPVLIPTGAASFEYVHPDDRAGLRSRLLEAMRDQQDYSVEYRGLWADGSIRWIRSAGRVMRNEDGSTRFIGVNTDVTDRKLAQEVVLQTEKLAAVGRLASVISHEINNPLESVTNLLFIVRSSPSLSRDDREHLELADRELARVSQITAQALRPHRSVDHPDLIDADKMVQELLELFRTRLSASNIRIKLDLQEEVVFQAIEGEIRQVLNNLIGNAFDSMRHGGTLRIRSRRVTDPKTGRRGVSLTIADDGAGIALPDRVFEAFYSTKGINGTGLGLWTSKRIVDKHGGSLSFRTAAGRFHGSVFRMWVPAKAALIMPRP